MGIAFITMISFATDKTLGYCLHYHKIWTKMQAKVTNFASDGCHQCTPSILFKNTLSLSGCKSRAVPINIESDSRHFFKIVLNEIF